MDFGLTHGVQDKKAVTLSFRVALIEIIKNTPISILKLYLFRGQLKLELHPDWACLSLSCLPCKHKHKKLVRY